MEDDGLGGGAVEGLVELDAVGGEVEGEDGEVLVGGERAGRVAGHVLAGPGEDVGGGVEGDVALGAGAGIEGEGLLADDGWALVGALAGVAVALGAAVDVER